MRCNRTSTFEWGSFRLFGKVPHADVVIGLTVAIVTVLTDLQWR